MNVLLTQEAHNLFNLFLPLMNDPESVVTGWKVYYSGLMRNGGSCVRFYCWYIGYLKLLRDLG